MLYIWLICVWMQFNSVVQVKKYLMSICFVPLHRMISWWKWIMEEAEESRSEFFQTSMVYSILDYFESLMGPVALANGSPPKWCIKCSHCCRSSLYIYWDKDLRLRALGICVLRSTCKSYYSQNLRNTF